MCDLLPTADGRDPCPFCGAIAEAITDPIVARLVNRLCDELTVCRLRQETPRKLLKRVHPTLAALPLARLAPKTKNWQRSAVTAALAAGPQRAVELALQVYGPPADAAIGRANEQAMRALCSKMCKQGQLARVGRGWYALPGATDGMVFRGRAALVRSLGHGRVKGRGLTIGQLVGLLHRDESTIYWWLRQVEAAGYPLRRATTYRGFGGGRVVRYWIGGPPAPAAASPRRAFGPCRALLEEQAGRGLTTEEIAARFGVGRNTVYAWLSRFRRHGLPLRSRAERPASGAGAGRRVPVRRWWIERAAGSESVA